MAALPGPATTQWDKLAFEAGNIFGTRSWNECWWQHFGAGTTPFVLTDQEETPQVILPVHLRGGLIKQLRMLGNGVADELGPICLPDHRSRGQELLRDFLTLPDLRWDVLLLQDVASPHDWRTLRTREINRVASPVVRFDTSVWEEFLATRSRNFRSNIKRKFTRLNKDYSVDFRLASVDTLAADLEALFRLHLERWGPKAPFATGRQRRFHEDFAAEAMTRGWLRLWMLELDGTIAGAQYGFRFADDEYYYQAGRDPRFESHSIGGLLLTHAIRCAVEDKMRQFRLLRGAEAYKSHFANEDHEVCTLAAAHGRKGALAIKMAQARTRTRSWMY